MGTGSDAPVYVTTRDDESGLTTVSLARGQAVLAPFVAPEIGRFEVVRALLLAVRVAMTVWAFTLGAVAARSADDVVSLDRAVRTLTVIGVVIAALWFVLGAVWAVLRTRNVRRLDGRYPTRWRAARVWVYAPVWITLMSFTLVRLEPHPDLDIRPPIIVVGFVLAMQPVYRIVQRIFKSLVRVRPDAATFVLFLVDTIAFGLIWWRIADWPDRAVDIDSTTTDLITSAAFAAAIALLVGLLAAVYLDLEADCAEDTRLLALRTRHDHRIARLQGLDPLESATRWALWTARQAADRAAADVAAAPPQAATAPPAPATIEPVGLVVDPLAGPLAPVAFEPWTAQPAPGAPAPAVSDHDGEDTEPSTVERLRRLAEHERGLSVAGSPVVPPPAVPVPPAVPAPQPAVAADDAAPAVAARAGGDAASPRPVGEDSVARALRRRFAEAERDAQRSRRGPGGGTVPQPPADVVSGPDRELAVSIGADLDSGVRRDFADRVRRLSQRFDPGLITPERSRDAGVADAPGTTQSASTGDRAHPPRLIALELARYLTVGLLIVAAIAAGWMLVAVSRFGAPDSVFDVEGLEVARAVAVLGFLGAGIVALGWAFGAASYASKLEPTVQRWRFGAPAVGAVVAAVVAAAVEGRTAGPWSLGAMILVSALLLVALRGLLPVFDMFSVTVWTLNAWLFATVATVVFILASPLGSEFGGSVDAGRVAFGAVLVGLSSMIGAVLVSLTTAEYENALRGSTELARISERRRARSRDTSGSSRPPSGSPPSG